MLYGKLLNLDGTVFRGPDYTVDVYADTTVSGMEEVIADLAEGEMQMHPIEEYKNTVAEPCEAHTYEAIAAGSITTNTCTACGDVVKTTSAARLDKAVQTYVFGDVRITVLSDSVVRVEQAADGEFVDAATLIVPSRDEFEGAEVSYDSDGDTAVIMTDDIIINVPASGATAADVRIFDAEMNSVFDFYSAYLCGTYSSLPAPADTPDAWVLFDNGIIPTEDGLTYVGSEDETSGWRRTDNVDYYVLLPLGDSTKLRSDFVSLTGRTAMSNIKFYGSWYSRWSSMTSEEKLAMIAEYREHGIPLDVIVIDTEWKTGEDGTGYSVNTELYPDMEGFLTAANEAGVLVLFNDHTHQTSITILTPSELKWQCAGITSLMKMGLDGWWYDRNWSYTIQSQYSSILYSTIGQVLYYDTMAKYHSDTAADGTQNRVLMLTNADWIKHSYISNNPSIIGHRYGMQWTGDIYGDVLTLQREIENTVVSGVVGGSPYISADLGGFRNNDTVSENAFIRWMQFGAFASAMRVHSDINPKNPHYPWSYTEVAETAVGNYMNMRYNLMPYHYALARETYETGMPVVRRLDFHYPQYEESQDNTQYLLGRDILVAPYNGTAGDGTRVVPSSWLKTSAGENGLDAAYYNTEGVTKAKYFDGTPVYTETVEEVTFFWDRWAPNGLGDDYFAVRYSGTITPEVDCYIGIVVDDGARIYIDGELFAGSYSNLFADSDMNTTDMLKAGETYEIVIEYYELTAKAQLHLVYDPAIDDGYSTRTVFIPDGEWIDVFTGEVITGPKTVVVTKDVYSSPLYVRLGAVIPTTAVVSPMENADWQNISLNLYGLVEGSTTIYEDDGTSENYLDGEYRKTEVTVTSDGETATLTIGAAVGDFTTDYTERNISVRVHSDTPITAALVNGKSATVEKIEKDETANPFAESGASPASDVYEITFTADMADEYTVTVTTAEEGLTEDTLGDVNGDGTVTIADVLITIKAILNKTKINADMNADGKVTLVDVIRMLKLIAA